MCGILGVVGPGAAASPIERHLDLIGHRGPDQSNVVSGNRFAFGHSLLSIIGREPVPQPYVSANSRILLTFNGEIYNYVEILAADPQLAQRCSGTSDTEVLAEGIAEYGIDFVKKLNGMFAFAAIDQQTGVAYLARDRLGIKPLYVAHKGSDIYFGSELRAVTATADLAGNPDPTGFYSYARFRYPLGNRTFDQRVQMLTPGTTITIAPDGSRRSDTYWSVEEQSAFAGTFDDAVTTARELLEDSVRIRMRSDHSFCSYLSGGVDSSLLAAMAVRAEGKLDTYSISIGSGTHDEGPFARDVALHLGTTHHPSRLDAAAYRSEMEDVVAHLGSPILVPNQVALSSLSRELSRDHRCVLSGEGADEVFGGYGRIFLLPIDWDALTSNNLTPEGKRVAMESIAAKLGTASFERYEDMFMARYGYLSHDQAVDTMQPYFSRKDLDDARRAIEAEIRQAFERHTTSLFTKQLLVFQEIHLPGLLLRLDAATMAHGVEARVPFLDHRLVEFMNRLPIEIRMPRHSSFASAVASGSLSDDLSEVHDIPKAVLKTIAGDWLPQEIVHRRKLGFPIPPNYYSDMEAGTPYQTWVGVNMKLLTGAKGQSA